MAARMDYLGVQMASFSKGGQEFVVDRKYAPVKAIGSGAYGVVCACVDQEAKRKIAIKKITNVFEDMVDAKRIMREVKMLAHFNHPNVIQLFDLVPPRNKREFRDMYLVLEYMETDLHKIIYSKNVLTFQHYQYFLHQLLKGLKYIHSAGVIHRDLKPSNILLNANCDLKICDFGLARSTGDENIMTQYVVTRWYRAPEIMCCDEHYDAKVDMWSVGCILAEMIKRKPLFPGDHYIQQLNLIFQMLGTPSNNEISWIENRRALQFIRSRPPMKGKNLKKIFNNVSAEGLNILQSMLQFNPNQRISVDEALSHNFLSSYHTPGEEVEAEVQFDYTYEAYGNDSENLKNMMYQEILNFRCNTTI